MLSELTQLQSVLEELTVKSKDPYVLPPASEQVILDIKGQDGSKWSFPVSPQSRSIWRRKLDKTADIHQSIYAAAV